MNRLAIKNRYVYFLSIQLTAVFLLYVILPGRVALTLTAFQPDSINSLCMGLLWFQNDPDSISRILNAIADKFYADGVVLGCSPELTPPYRTRFFLSFLIGLFSLTGIWWFVLLPSILVYLLIGYIFWRIGAEFYTEIRVKQLYLFLPFLSPHIAWFLANVMTEAPLMLSILGLIYFTYVKKLDSRNLEYLVISILFVLALISKQSWPIMTVVIGAYLVTRNPRKKKPFLYLIALSISIIFAQFVKAAGSYLYGDDFGTWNDFAVFQNPMGAIEGIVLGLRNDLYSLFEFGDVFGVLGIGIATWIIFAKIKTLEIRLILWTAVAWGLATMGSVYLADGSYGQNWRFLVFASFLAYPLYLIDKHRTTNKF